MDHGPERELAPDEAHAVARSELLQSGGWGALGLAVLVGSLRMDRLESQNINPYTVPGLLPGLLGTAMMLLAGLLALRSWRRGALAASAVHVGLGAAAARRVLLVLVLCVGFGVGLVGRGLPFWLAAALFVSIAIVTLQQPMRAVAGRKLGPRDVAIAVAVGLGAGGAITLVFQQVFLVRLP